MNKLKYKQYTTIIMQISKNNQNISHILTQTARKVIIVNRINNQIC